MKFGRASGLGDQEPYAFIGMAARWRELYRQLARGVEAFCARGAGIRPKHGLADGGWPVFFCRLGQRAIFVWARMQRSKNVVFFVAYEK